MLVRLMPTVKRTDAIQSFTCQETPIVRITDADGASGAGYSYTIGTGGASVMQLIHETFAPALIGREANEIERIWRDLMFRTHATTVGPITAIAQAAIDTALWDLRCRRAGLPLHLMAGGAQPSVPLYTTEGGWLHLEPAALVDDTLRAKEAGFGGAKIKMVYQDLALCDTVDVAGNLLLGREPLRWRLGVPLMDKPAMHARATEMLSSLGIRMPSTRLKVESLSGGQRQSIAIGRAVSFDPLVLIMDEPTAALAVAEVDAVLRLIRTVSARGVSVILITHRLQDLFVVCDRIMVLFEGKNVAERRIGETNIEEIVNLIVGRKFQSVSASHVSIGARPA